MGYRALLKNYIRQVTRLCGDHYIEALADAEALGKRELAELRLLAAEVEREDYQRIRSDAPVQPAGSRHPAKN